MALYLGNSDKLIINLNGSACILNLFPVISVVNNVRLLSSDNCILKDSSGMYLVPSDYTQHDVDNVLLSLD